MLNFVRSDSQSDAQRRPRPRARGPHRASAPAVRSGDLMNQLLVRIGGPGRAREFHVFECYARVVGETLRTRTMPERLVGSTLFIQVASSALAHELTLLRGEILTRMAREIGADVVTELRTRVGRIPAAAG